LSKSDTNKNNKITASLPENLNDELDSEKERLGNAALVNTHDSGGAVEDTSAQVLVVDDDPTVRMIAEHILEENGFAVLLAENGIEALSIIKQQPLDLILLDVEMPQMDGFAVCENLRALPDKADIPVIMLTGRDDLEASQQAFDVKATDFYNKPINWSVLIQRIHYILRASITFEKLKKSQQRLVDAQQVAKLGYWDLDMESNHFYASEQCSEVYGRPREDFSSIGSFMQIVHAEDRGRIEQEIANKFTQGDSYTLEYRVITSENEIRILQVHGKSVISESGKAVWAMGVVQDITELRVKEETIHNLAYFDSLTGLDNRESFMQQLERSLILHEQAQTPVTVFFMDLDDFKRVNDSLGHHVGDLLLKEFANRLTSALWSNDMVSPNGEKMTVARLGGDEFTMLFPGIGKVEEVAIIAKRVLLSLIEVFKLEAKNGAGEATKNELFVSVSIGIARYPEDGATAGELLKNADAAMYASKKEGKNAYSFYTNSMNAEAKARLELETQLRKALEQEELFIHYQPQVDLVSGEMVGVEALLRWKNPTLGMVSPVDFIPLAEETGLIIPIGEWVIQTVCQQLKQWQNSSLPFFKGAVNLSSLQFKQEKLQSIVLSALEANDLKPQYLELELTESIIMGDVEHTVATLEAFKAMGVSLSIDDFGTGYSSLSYLKRFPIDTLKIDQSFVREIGVDLNDTAITRAIIALGQNLSLTIVAEGVETEDQLQFLQEQSCEVAQGYLFSKPILASEIAPFIECLKYNTLLGKQSS